MDKERLEEIKNTRIIDWYIIYMLFHGVGVSDISRRLDVSRQYIYTVKQRSKDLLLKLGLLDITE